MQRGKWSAHPIAAASSAPPCGGEEQVYAVRLIGDGRQGFICELQAVPIDPEALERIQRALRRRERANRIWVVRARSPEWAVWMAGLQASAEQESVSSTWNARDCDPP